MKFAEMCRECRNRFVVALNDDGEPSFIGCMPNGTYERIARVSEYDWLKRVYAFSPSSKEFINPAKEFRFLVGDDMELENKGSLTFSMANDRMMDIFVRDPKLFPVDCPYYAEVAIEYWNKSEGEK